MVRFAVWQMTLALAALALLCTERATAQTPPDVTSLAPPTSSDESRLALTEADGTPEPPPEAVPPAGAGAESVPPGQAEPADGTPAPDGAPLPDIQDVLAENQPWTPVVSSNCWFAPNHWYTEADFVVVNHGRSKRNPIFAGSPATQAFLGQQDLTLGITEGARFTLGMWRFHDTYGWDHAVEFSFFGLPNWHKNFEIDVPGNIDIDGLTPGNSVLAYYKSLFNSGGIDLRWTKRASKDELVYDPDGYWKRQAESGAVFSFFLGIHDTELDEKFDLRVTGSSTAPADRLDYHSRTTNNLLGLHVGTELDYKHDLWYVGIRGGAAPSITFAEFDADLHFNDPNPSIGAGSVHNNVVVNTPGCVSDFGMLAGWQIRPNVRVQVSYDFTWLTSIGLAPSQFRLGNFQPQGFSVTNDLLLTDMSLGLQINW